MKVSDVLDRARTVLQDADAVYWESDELPMWLTDGRLEAYRLRPDIYEASEDFTCAEGARQKLPGSARMLFD
ncbi:MAG: phage adaptor protein, partial [Achromobacter mucicolens]